MRDNPMNNMQNNPRDGRSMPRPTAPSQQSGARRPQPDVRQRPSGQPNPPERNEKKGGRNSRWGRAILMVLATIGLCVFLTFFILQSANDLFGLNQADNFITVEIPQNASISQVSDILTKAEIVDQGFTFRLYAGLKMENSDIKPGKYIFNTNMGYDEIILGLRVGDSVKEEVRIVFIEGRTISQIAKQLEEKKVCSADEFIAYLQTAEFGYEFMDMLPQSEYRFQKLEGYLFPDTYDFYVGENVKDVAKKFLKNFNDKMTPALQKKMQEMNMTIDETIVLASIIQREAGDPDDMAKVSSAFHNRLNDPGNFPNLQSDVTILYVNNDIKPYLQQSNQAMYDKYNTYKCVGLPVGAICNPGLDAIKAALNPADTKYLFFVTDKNEEFYYAETAAVHYKNVAKAKAVGGEAHGIDTIDE